MKTEREIIVETYIEYVIKKSPRGIGLVDAGNGVKHRRCMYYVPETGAMCAVGRCLQDPTTYARNTSVISERSLILDNLRAEYKGHPQTFWSNLQTLHDNYMDQEMGNTAYDEQEMARYLYRLWEGVECRWAVSVSVVQKWFTEFHTRALEKYNAEMLRLSEEVGSSPAIPA